VASRRATSLGTLVAFLAAFAGSSAVVRAQRGLEYEVKAAYLFNIVSFVTWPPDAFGGPADPIRLCVFDKDPFGPMLDNAIRGAMVDQHPIMAERIGNIDMVSRCHLVFVPHDSADWTDQVRRAAAQRPILIVGESDDFLQHGGMIAFVIEGGRVRFDVNVRTAASQGLKISSRLLQVARRIYGKGPS
jgi:hypothetical protein